MTRAEQICCHFDRTMRLIEIGPSHNQGVAKADAWQTTIIDHASQHDLLEKYATVGVATLDRIEPVDSEQDAPPPLTALRCCGRSRVDRPLPG